MFINLESDHSLRSRDIISIMDYSVVTSSSIMEEMIDLKGNEKKVIGVKSKAKSIVITNDLIYYSSLSVPTLKKRSTLSSTVKKLEKYPPECEQES